MHTPSASTSHHTSEELSSLELRNALQRVSSLECSYDLLRDSYFLMHHQIVNLPGTDASCAPAPVHVIYSGDREVEVDDDVHLRAGECEERGRVTATTTCFVSNPRLAMSVHTSTPFS